MNRKQMVIALFAALLTHHLQAYEPPAVLQGVAFDQRLNEQVPLDARFKDEAAQDVALGDYFHGKPVILVLAYYQCPRLCTMVLNGVVQGLLEIPYVAGKDFEVVVISFDPTETPDLAAAKKAAYIHRYGRSGAGEGWHFLTGDEEQIRRVADAVGFHYTYDVVRKQYVHASGITFLTPEGIISRYLYDVRFAGRDVRLALYEASQHQVGSPVEQVLLYCFHYDPTLGRYSANVMVLVRLLGLGTMLAIGVFVWRLSRRPRTAKDLPVTPLPAGGAS